jgi:hypothetical protein
MSIELQLQSSILTTIIERVVQARINTTCFAPIGSVYVDHADVAASPIEIVTAGDAVRFRVPLDVFIVQREDVLAANNGIPIGATVPAATIVVILEMATMGAIVSLMCVDTDLGILVGLLGDAAPGAKATIIQAIGSAVQSDLSTVLSQLGMPTITSSRVELIESIISIQFEPVGNAITHLLTGQEWGIFISGVSVEQLALSKVPLDSLRAQISSLTVKPHWRPVGDIPHVDIDYAGKVAVPNPFSGDVDGIIACDFSLTPTSTKFLSTTVNWSFNINLGGIVPGGIDKIVAQLAKDRITKSFDLTKFGKFGATSIGEQAFTFDTSLPNVSLGGAKLNYTSISASPDGMTIGGTVSLPEDPGKDTLKPSIGQFSLPYRLELCSILAKSGSGAPTKTASISEVTTRGGVSLENLGLLCKVEIVSPGNWIEQYIQQSSNGIGIVIPSAVALGIIEPVRLIVRTARGVRLIDLGTPPNAVIDANGNVINALLDYIPDCLYTNADPLDEHGINWGSGDVIPPLENPDWTIYLGEQPGINVQLVTLSDLEPGELIQFRSQNHAIDVTADSNGRALVPVFLPVANQQELASLIRVNRRSIADNFTVQTVAFVKQANLPAGNQNTLTSSIDGTTILTTEFTEYVDTHEFGLIGAPILLRREAVEIALNPQPLPPKEGIAPVYNPLISRKIDLSGLKSLVPVPGFADAPIALALMTDGSTLVLDLIENETARVAGIFTGPIGTLDVSGGWAAGLSTDGISIFRVIQS